MSRVHDALRKAAHDKPELSKPPAPPARPRPSASYDAIPAERVVAEVVSQPGEFASTPVASTAPSKLAAAVFADTVPNAGAGAATDFLSEPRFELDQLEEIIGRAKRVPFNPQKDALLVNPMNPREAPAEEFRTLRTRLNHMQTLQPIHTVVVTSASPAEGKSFTASNLAITQAQLADKRVLLCDFDFRRPTADKTFQIPPSPGITDYLLGKARVEDILQRVGDTQLYIITAGEPVTNPLELLNLKECKALIDALRNHFDWVILDSPPLLFAADGNLLSTMCDGTILVVRIGTTTFDSVTRAIQSLCENNVLGVVVNGARRGELYSKYTYYHDYYYYPPEGDGEESNQLVEPVEETTQA